MRAHLTEDPPAVKQRRNDVSDRLSDLIASCLDKQPSLRPRNAAFFARTLDEPEILAAVETKAQQTRRPWLTPTLVVIGIVAIAAASMYLSRSYVLPPK